MAQQSKRLYRSRSDRMLTGVLGGASEYIGADPSLVRIGYVLVLIFTGFFPLLVLYVVMAIIVPETPEGASPPDEEPS